MLRYEIRVKGRLDSRWTDWLGGLTVAPTRRGDTLLAGALADQAALHGVLERIRDLNLTLLAVRRVEARREDPPGPAGATLAEAE